MNVKTKTGKEIDVSEWVEQIRTNLAKGRDWNEQTPFGINIDGDYWWWDEEKNPLLDKRSVNKLVKSLKVVP